jgi:hypothetical protein
MASMEKIASAFEKADFAFTVVSVVIGVISLVGIYLNYRHTTRLHDEIAEVKALCKEATGNEGRVVEKISRYM